MSQQKLIDKAISDIEYIRQVIEGSNASNESHKALKIQLLLNSIATLGAAGLLVVNISDPGIFDLALSGSSSDDSLRRQFLIAALFVLGSALTICYGIIWRATRDSELNFSDFLQMKFRYLVFQNFVSDLFIKVAIFTAAIVMGYGPLVPILLSFFTIDYVLQGRLFHFPKTIQVTLGIGMFVLGLSLFSSAQFTLSTSFVLFLIPAILSCMNILRQLLRASE